MSIKQAVQCKLGKHTWEWQFLPDSCKQQHVCVHCQKVSETREQSHSWGEWQSLEGTLDQERICKRCQANEKRPIPVQIRNDQRGFGTLIEIPAGSFRMGSSRWRPGSTDMANSAFKKESPIHRVTLTVYWIGKTPVTVYQFRSFVQASGYQWASADKKQGDGNHPVVYVNWFDAQAYCKWLTDTWRISGFISADDGVQLPSEAEWEKAARGIDVRTYPWGNKAIGYGHFEKLGPTKPVGTFSPKGDSPYGCVDMAGNVKEWTRSIIKDYPYDPSDGRESLKSKRNRVLRGGGFRSGFDYVRAAWREEQNPQTARDDIGFRVVLRPAKLKNN